MKKLFCFYTACLWLSLMMFGVACSKAKMSERDQRREQVRINAETKRKELAAVAGNYEGIILQTSGVQQTVFLNLEVKDVPHDENGGIDAVMVPTITGSLRFIYGRKSENSEAEVIGFGLKTAEFDQKQKRLNLLATNEEYKDVMLDLTHANEGLKGNWTAPQTSNSGSIELYRAGSKAALALGEKEVHPVRGEYRGVLNWEKEGTYQFGELAIISNVKPPDGLKLSGTLKLFYGDWSSKEQLTYRFDEVEFNPISGQLSLKGTESDIGFVGVIDNGNVTGEWSSKVNGRIGAARFQKSGAPETPNKGSLHSDVSGNYRGTTEKIHANSNLPERVAVNILTSPDLSQPNGIKLSGNIRFYVGGYSSKEFVELQFSEIQFNSVTRELVAKTSGAHRLTVKARLDKDVLDGKISDEALGDVAKIKLTKNGDVAGAQEMQGEYNGFLLWKDGDFQHGQLTFLSAADVSGELRISANLKLIFGEKASAEFLTYQFDQVQYNLVTGQIQLKNDKALVSIVGIYKDGKFTGEWFHIASGRQGAVEFSKNSLTPPSVNLITQLRGTYQGSLQNTNPQSNLTPRMMLNFVTSQDLNEPNGIKVTGNMRLYEGDFDSAEFTELQFTEIRFNFFTRELIAKTSTPFVFTLKGTLEQNKIAGILYHDGLGPVANVEVTRQ